MNNRTVQRLSLRVLALVPALFGCASRQGDDAFTTNYKIAIAERRACNRKCHIAHMAARDLCRPGRENPAICYAENPSYFRRTIDEKAQCSEACQRGFDDRAARVDRPDYPQDHLPPDREDNEPYNSGNPRPSVPLPHPVLANHDYRVSDGTCRVENTNVAVPVLPATRMQQSRTGWAKQVNGQWVITLIEDEMKQFTPAVQRFLFAHECGHVNSGDFSANMENSANCWAARRLSEENGMTVADWKEVRNALVKAFPTRDGLYKPGHEQFADIENCARNR